MYSSESVSNVILIAMVILVAVAVLRWIRRGTGRYTDPDALTLWSKPVLVVAGAMGLAGDTAASIDGATIFALAFAIGALCALTAFGPFRVARDYLLSGVSVLLTLAVVVVRLASGWDVAVVVLVYLAALAAGLALGGVPKALAPQGGMAILGGISILDFVLSPFGIASFPSTTASSVAVGCICAVAAGAMVRFAPTLAVYLGSLSVAILAIALQVFLAVQNQTGTATGLEPDWSQALGVLGTALGYTVMRFPFILARRLARIRP